MIEILSKEALLENIDEIIDDFGYFTASIPKQEVLRKLLTLRDRVKMQQENDGTCCGGKNCCSDATGTRTINLDHEIKIF